MAIEDEQRRLLAEGPRPQGIPQAKLLGAPQGTQQRANRELTDEEIMEGVRMTFDLGPEAFIQVMQQVDPSTAKGMQQHLIGQRKAQLKGKAGTDEMSKPEFNQYLNDVASMGELATIVESSQNKEQSYQSVLPAIKKLDPNAPDKYDSNYTNVALSSYKPLQKRFKEFPEVEKAVRNPGEFMSPDEIRRESPNIDVDTPATKVMESEDGSFRIYERDLGDNKVEVITQNDGKITKKVKNRTEQLPNRINKLERRLDAIWMRKKAAEREIIEAGDSPNDQKLKALRAKEIDDLSKEESDIRGQLGDIIKSERDFQEEIALKQFDAALDQQKELMKEAKVEKSTRAKIEKDILEAESSLSNLRNLKDNFNPAVFTYHGKISSYLTAEAERLGVPVSDARKQFAADFKSAENQINQIFLAYRKLITGVAGGEKEMKDIRNATINTDLSESQGKRVLEDLINKYQRDILVKSRLAARGILPKSDEDLDYTLEFYKEREALDKAQSQEVTAERIGRMSREEKIKLAREMDKQGR